MSKKECCGNCRFFDWPVAAIPEGARANISFCDRYPPVFTGEPGWEEAGESGNWSRPLVYESEFCGEFQPIPPES